MSAGIGMGGGGEIIRNDHSIMGVQQASASSQGRKRWR